MVLVPHDVPQQGSVLLTTKLPAEQYGLPESWQHAEQPPPPLGAGAGAGAGCVITITEEGLESALTPFAFVAVTTKLYELPFVSPVKVKLVLVEVKVVEVPTILTVYRVIVEPPFAGAVHETLA